VLKAAMEGQHGPQPDFEANPSDSTDGPFGDWLDPPSPFAMLLFRVFGSHLDPADFSAESPRWQQVIEAFADRFSLWRRLPRRVG
jgi:hypothetical protein